ncbi:MAG: outer membrane protein TolC [Parvicella sp.]|jgi:outer membrane protein TolC
MIKRFNITLIVVISLLGISTKSWAQDQVKTNESNSASISFNNLNDLISYAHQQSTTLQTNSIKTDQAKKAKLAAALGTIDVTGSLLSAQITDNTKLGISLFPAEIFGGAPGTFKEVQTGIQYNTNLNSYIDVKLINPAGWANLNLAKINIDLTEMNNQISQKNLSENIANNYYNILNLKEQIASSKKNIAISDTLFQITQQKYKEGLVKQQDVNTAKVNLINMQENSNQLEYLLEQYYISLKLLCDAPENVTIQITENVVKDKLTEKPNVLINDLQINYSSLQERYALSNLQSAKLAFAPTLSLQFSNSFNLYNSELTPFSGNWINSNYIGLRLNIPIPNTLKISKNYNAQFEYQIATKKTEQAQNSASLEKQTLENDYKKVISQVNSNTEILRLQNDTYVKNQNLYTEGVIGLDDVINSFNSKVNAEYNLITSEVNVQLVIAKININNNNK